MARRKEPKIRPPARRDSAFTQPIAALIKAMGRILCASVKECSVKNCDQVYCARFTSTKTRCEIEMQARYMSVAGRKNTARLMTDVNRGPDENAAASNSSSSRRPPRLVRYQSSIPPFVDQP